jgi:5-formyltetrahydrofolate cyclo-ligase
MKDILREYLIKKRKNISDSEILNKSKLIEKNLFRMDEFRSSNTILFYVSYNNEVYTHDMIKKSLLMNKNIIVPISDVVNKKLILSKLDRWDELQKGSYNILEPKRKEENEILLDSINLIIVPAIGFDMKGNRLGHGFGYYDNLLKDSNKATHIGLAFEFQIIDQIKIEKHDIPVDIIITENGIIYC